MFYNLMSLFHDKLPCSQNFFRLKKIFRTKLRAAGDGSDSPIRSIASPSLMQKNASRKNSVSSFVSSGGASSKSGGRSGKLSAFAGSKSQFKSGGTDSALASDDEDYNELDHEEMKQPWGHIKESEDGAHTPSAFRQNRIRNPREMGGFGSEAKDREEIT
jgi:hypothetical protein